MPKITQLVNGAARTWKQVGLLISHVPNLHTHCLLELVNTPSMRIFRAYFPSYELKAFLFIFKLEIDFSFRLILIHTCMFQRRKLKPSEVTCQQNGWAPVPLCVPGPRFWRSSVSEFKVLGHGDLPSARG